MKTERYVELVRDRKACRLCSPQLTNPSAFEEGRYDSEHIGPWSRWQGNLNAPLLVVGQDWGDTRYFKRVRGWEKPGNPTNVTLAKLLASIEIDVPPPGASPTDVPIVFFTNAILCLKEGGLQAAVRAEWFSNCRRFLRRQIELVRPLVVVGLGRHAFESVLAAFDIEAPPFGVAVRDRVGTLIPSGSRVFAVYHCGSRVLNTGRRPMDAQLADWRRIGEALRAMQEGRLVGGPPMADATVRGTRGFTILVVSGMLHAREAGKNRECRRCHAKWSMDYRSGETPKVWKDDKEAPEALLDWVGNNAAVECCISERG